MGAPMGGGGAVQTKLANGMTQMLYNLTKKNKKKYKSKCRSKISTSRYNRICVLMYCSYAFFIDERSRYDNYIYSCAYVQFIYIYSAKQYGRCVPAMQSILLTM